MYRRIVAAVVLAILIGALAFAQERGALRRDHSAPPEISYYNSPEFAKLALPFSEATRAGDYVYTAVIGNLPGTLTLAEGGIEAETRQCFENLKRVLEANGSSLDQVVKCTVMLTDMNEWSAMNRIYASYFPAGRAPARASFGVTALAVGARVEIDCVAVVAKP